MRTLHALALLPALGLAMVACSTDDSAAPDTTTAPTAVETTAATSSTEPAADTTTPTSDTQPTSESTDGPAQSGPVQIDVVVGVDSGPDRVERVAVGSDITLNITNPDADDEFHIHVVDFEQAAPAGQMATFNFTADTPGEYEVESHVTEDVLLIIEVG